jgi:hypothetical protein
MSQRWIAAQNCCEKSLSSFFVARGLYLLRGTMSINQVTIAMIFNRFLFENHRGTLESVQIKVFNK